MSTVLLPMKRFVEPPPAAGDGADEGCVLLGAGLVSLSHLGGPVGKLINDVAGGLHGATSDPSVIQAAKVIAGSVMIGFTVLGILGGYIITSTWYQKKINELG